MKQNFTQEQLILYVYDELRPEVVKALETELKTNVQLQEELKSLKSTMNLLDQVKSSPSKTNIKIILEESRSSTGSFETS